MVYIIHVSFQHGCFITTEDQSGNSFKGPLCTTYFKIRKLIKMQFICHEFQILKETFSHKFIVSDYFPRFYQIRFNNSLIPNVKHVNFFMMPKNKDLSGPIDTFV